MAKSDDQQGASFAGASHQAHDGISGCPGSPLSHHQQEASFAGAGFQAHHGLSGYPSSPQCVQPCFSGYQVFYLPVAPSPPQELQYNYMQATIPSTTTFVCSPGEPYVPSPPQELQNNYMPATIPATTTFVGSPALAFACQSEDVPSSDSDSDSCYCLKAIKSGEVCRMPVQPFAQASQKRHRRRGGRNKKQGSSPGSSVFSGTSPASAVSSMGPFDEDEPLTIAFDSVQKEIRFDVFAENKEHSKQDFEQFERMLESVQRFDVKCERLWKTAVEKCHTVERTVEVLRGSMLQFSCQKYGCRFVQAAFDNLGSQTLRELVPELQGHVVEMIKGEAAKHSNFVVQKMIEIMPPAQVPFVVRELSSFGALKIACEQYGCRVVQRLLESCSMTSYHFIQPVIDTLMSNVKEMCRSAYGHHVVVSILEHGLDSQKATIAEILRVNIGKMLESRHGRAVYCAAIKSCSMQDTTSLACTLFSDLSVLCQLAQTHNGHNPIEEAVSPQALSVVGAGFEQMFYNQLMLIAPHLQGAIANGAKYGQHTLDLIRKKVAQQASCPAAQCYPPAPHSVPTSPPVFCSLYAPLQVQPSLPLTALPITGFNNDCVEWAVMTLHQTV